MSNLLKKLIVAISSTVFAVVALAEEPAPPAESAEQMAAKLESSLKYQTGEIKLSDGLATLRLPAEFRYLDPEQTKKLLEEGWGNPDGGGTLGMIVPSATSPMSDNGWGVIVTYEENGYVSDKDADSINYDDLLKEMQSSIKDENEERKKAGYGSIELVGWAERPSYDKATHKMYWAKDLRFDGSDQHTLNYNIRVLGRRGVLVLNAVAGMSQLAAIKTDMQKVIAFTDFNPGHSYTDFDSKTDKVASYGLAALVAGGIAAKTGLLAKLVALLIAAKKLVVLAIAGIAAFFSKLFKRAKT
ncbi:MAG: DUF2167 domain-containing protein [Gammaproteobacteria bacterium]